MKHERNFKNTSGNPSIGWEGIRQTKSLLRDTLKSVPEPTICDIVLIAIHTYPQVTGHHLVFSQVYIHVLISFHFENSKTLNRLYSSQHFENKVLPFLIE